MHECSRARLVKRVYVCAFVNNIVGEHITKTSYIQFVFLSAKTEIRKKPTYLLGILLPVKRRAPDISVQYTFERK